MNVSQGWCSIRLRVNEREVEALRCAEALHGQELSHSPSAEGLREALALMRAGRKVQGAGARAAFSLAEPEALALAAAARSAQRKLFAFRDQAVGWRSDERLTANEEAALKQAFPEVTRSAWEAYQIGRVLEAVAVRLEAPLSQGASDSARPRGRGKGGARATIW